MSIIIDLCPTERDRNAARANGRLPAKPTTMTAGPPPYKRPPTIEDRIAADFMAVVAEHSAENGTSKTASMRALTRAYPEAHQRWIQNLRDAAQAAGRSRK
jgi:hypothetical protein